MALRLFLPWSPFQTGTKKARLKSPISKTFCSQPHRVCSMESLQRLLSYVVDVEKCEVSGCQPDHELVWNLEISDTLGRVDLHPVEVMVEGLLKGKELREFSLSFVSFRVGLLAVSFKDLKVSTRNLTSLTKFSSSVRNLHLKAGIWLYKYFFISSAFS